MKPVTLEPAEMAACRMMGNLRTHACRVAGSKKGGDFGGDPIEWDENGFIGEYAFCKAHNLFFDITGIPRKHGYDCIKDGKRVDVKTTTWKNGVLLVYESHNRDVDVYVMAILDGLTVHFPGYCGADKFYKYATRIENTSRDRNGNVSYRYELPQELLSRWPE